MKKGKIDRRDVDVAQVLDKVEIAAVVGGGGGPVRPPCFGDTIRPW